MFTAQCLHDLARSGVDIADCLHLIAKQFDPYQPVFIGGADLQHISLHAETAAGISVSLRLYWLFTNSLNWLRMLRVSPTSNFTDALRYSLGNTQAIDAADRSHHDHVAALEQRPRRRVAQHVDLFVDRCRLGDVGVANRNVGLRLVVVVIRNEVLNGVLGEKLAQLVTELRRQGFVVSQHQRRPAGLGNDVGHRERLARARRPQQRLISLAVVHPLHELLDRCRLVTLRAVGRREVIGGHGCCGPNSGS